jgi:hypothetical protein
MISGMYTHTYTHANSCKQHIYMHTGAFALVQGMVQGMCNDLGHVHTHTHTYARTRVCKLVQITYIHAHIQGLLFRCKTCTTTLCPDCLSKSPGHQTIDRYVCIYACMYALHACTKRFSGECTCAHTHYASTPPHTHIAVMEARCKHVQSTYVYTYTCNTQSHDKSQRCLHKLMYAYKNTYVHTQIHTYIHTYTYTQVRNGSQAGIRTIRIRVHSLRDMRTTHTYTQSRKSNGQSWPQHVVACASREYVRI